MSENKEELSTVEKAMQDLVRAKRINDEVAEIDLSAWDLSNVEQVGEQYPQ